MNSLYLQKKMPPFSEHLPFSNKTTRQAKANQSLPVSFYFHPTKAQIMEISTAGRRLATLIRLPQMRLIPTQRMRLEPTRDRFERACGVMIGAGSNGPTA